MSDRVINSLLLGALLVVGAYFFLTTGPNAVTAANAAQFLGL